jgi:hypothetical protein
MYQVVPTPALCLGRCFVRSDYDNTRRKCFNVSHRMRVIYDKSVRPHVTAREVLKFVIGEFSKMYRYIPSLVKIGRKYRMLYVKVYIRFCASLV